MSDTAQGPGWWQASDGKWYPPDQQPGPAPGQMPYGYTQHGYGYAYGPAHVYSGFWRRFAAGFLDGLIISVPTRILSTAVSAGSTGALFGTGLSPGASAAVTLINTVFAAAYYGYLEGTRGQTIGKMALGIKVVDADNGELIGIPRAVGRYFASFLSAIAFGLGYLWMLWDPRKQCWHDKLVRSVVLKTQR
jgi:uncharacterized RDD family membrane protein YckC